jgi:Predicted membrane protein
MSNRARLAQFLRFCTVGCANTAIDFTAFFLLNLVGVPHLLAQVLAYSAGVANSFVLNRKWTFSLAGRTNAGEVLKFVIVNSISLLVSASLLYFMYDIHNMNLWLAKAAATIGGIIINYAGSRIWVFSGNRPGWPENAWRLSERTR